MISPKQFLVGFAEVDITPAELPLMAGYYYERRATGVHDRLYARSMAIGDGQTVVVLCVTDLIFSPVELVAATRAAVQEKCRLPPEQVILAAIHSHTSPDLRNEKAYAAGLPERLAECVAQALQKLAPRDLRVGRTQPHPGVQFIRRYRMKDGSVRTNPGIGNPEIQTALGTPDPDLMLLMAEEKGKLRGGVVHFALHCDTVGGTELSADWIHYLRERMRGEMGKDFALLTPIGPSGDINHWDVFGEGALRGFAETQRIGHNLGDGALKACGNLQPIPVGPVRVLRRCVEVSTRMPTPEQLAQARVLMGQPPPPGVDFTLDRVIALRHMRVAEAGPHLSLEVTVLAFGNVAFATMPCELFTELGRRIKRASPFEFTFVCTHANGGCGYIGEMHNYAEGGYEVTSSIVTPGAGEALVEAAVTLLQEAAQGRR